MKFQPEKLISLRKELGITKAEAARRLNMSAMGYGRYENGEREPSFQTVSFIAQTFETTTDYLYGLTDNSQSDALVISHGKEPELFTLVNACKNNDVLTKRMLTYYKKLSSKS